jgi:hypothetical protein
MAGATRRATASISDWRRARAPCRPVPRARRGARQHAGAAGHVEHALARRHRRGLQHRVGKRLEQRRHELAFVHPRPAAGVRSIGPCANSLRGPTYDRPQSAGRP